MNEKILFILALTCTLSGILTILFISENVEIKLIQIKDINEDQIGKEIKVIATISSIKSTPGLYILTLKDVTSTIKAIIFKESDLNFKMNDKAVVTGEVVKYQNILEIQINELKVL